MLFEGTVPTKFVDTDIVNTDTEGGVKWTAVYLTSSATDIHHSIPPSYRAIATLELARGKLSPLVAIGLVGGRVEVVNNDVDTALIKVAGFELNESGFVKPNMRLTATVEEPEVSPAISVYEISGHHRKGWIVAPPTPYAALTNSKGIFTIDLIPEGDHVIRLWNPHVQFNRVLRRESIKFTIKANETTVLAPVILRKDDFVE